MPYFPLFVDLSQKRILVVGAGSVAARKIEKLLPFGPKIRCVAPLVGDEVQKWAEQGLIELEKRRYEDEDLVAMDMAIVAADDIALQEAIFGRCQQMRIPCNSVDSPKFCSFIFPALVLRGEMAVGLSTGGRAPGFSAVIREVLDTILPQELAAQLLEAEAYRKSQARTGTFKERADRVKALVKQNLSKILSQDFLKTNLD